MKKTNLQTFFGILLLAASAGSYAFLQSASLPQDIDLPSPLPLVDDAEASDEDTQIFLPDVELISRITEKVREHLPAQ